MSFQMNPAATEVSCRELLLKKNENLIKRTYVKKKKKDAFLIPRDNRVSGDSFIGILRISFLSWYNLLMQKWLVEEFPFSYLLSVNKHLLKYLAN